MARKKLLVLGGWLMVSATLFPVQVLALQRNPVGIAVSPFIQQIDVTDYDVQKTFTISYTNHMASLQELTLAARDFGSLNDTGGLIFEGSKGYTQKYGLASWLTLSKDTVTLQPGESTTVEATIDNRSSLQPGGHYGAIVASVGMVDPSKNDTVAIDQQLVALVLVTKTGGEHYDLKLNTIQNNGNWLHLPDTVKLRFQNPGNVHVIPRGVVKLKSPSGTVIAQGIINEQSSFVLPQSFREVIVDLKTAGSSLPLPGTYSLEVDYRYQGFERLAVKTKTVYFLNLGLYIVLFCTVCAGLYWFKFRKTSLHNES